MCSLASILESNYGRIEIFDLRQKIRQISKGRYLRQNRVRTGQPLQNRQPMSEPQSYIRTAISRTGNLAFGYDLSMIGGRKVRPWAVYRPIISLTANLRSAFGR